MHSRIYYLHALSALHVGTGRDGGVIDLPIAREKATGLPVVPGSSIKGVLRDELDGGLNADQHRAMFGPPSENAADHAGALAFGDARLLCLPVRSLGGTFAWVTCPLVLRRYGRDLSATVATIPILKDDEIAVCAGSVLRHANNKVFLEDWDLSAVNPDSAADAWAEHIGAAIFANDESWRNLFRQRLAIVADSVFDFLAETATEIVARIRIKPETRTVEKGGLWYEENLPAETLLWGMAAADRSRYDKVSNSGTELLDLLPAEERLQVGGKAGVGRGQVRWMMGTKLS